MDDSKLPMVVGGGLPFQGPHWHSPPSVPENGFVPMWLVLQPSGLAVELKKPNIVVGRHSQADIRLPLPDVSRRHCRFVFANGCWQVIDLNSLNGLFVNQELVRKVNLRQGDLIRIGGFLFEVHLQPAGTVLPRPDEDMDNKDPILRSIAGALPPSSTDPQSRHRRAS